MPGPTPEVPLIIGAGGLVGRAVTRLMEKAHAATTSATRTEIDVTDRFRLEAEVERLSPTLIVNCAALSDVERCELYPDLAREVNSDGAENLARAAAELGCRVIHVSTVDVFDGRSERPYVENAATGPLAVYGRTKLDGERRVAAYPDQLVVRTAWLYGQGRMNLVDAIREGLRDGGVLRSVDDQSGSPTHVEDLAGAILRLTRSDRRGVVHFANAGRCTRYELAEAIQRLEGSGASRLESMTSEEAGSIAERPANSALDSGLYSGITGCSPRPWREALAAYLAEPAPNAGPA